MYTYTQRFGQGPRKALAIHCTLAHSGALAGLAHALPDHFTTLAYDLPSHGRSSDWDGQGDVHDVATQMGLALLQEPMDIIGHSFGATVALRLAIEHPALVRSLIMIEPVFFAAALEDHPEDMRAAFGANRAFEEAMAQGDTYAAARIFNRDWGNGTQWSDFPQRLRDYMAERIHFVPASYDFLERDNAGLLEGNKFARARMPALLIKGEISPPIIDLIHQSIGRRLPDASYACIQGAGHMAPVTHPKQVAAQICDFLEIKKYLREGGHS